ncbi:MAG: acyl-CoA dehydrogenase family protein [Pseudoclavibacter sp.]
MINNSSNNPEVAAIVDRIDEIRPLLLENGPAGEKDRTIVQSSIDALAKTGAFRLTVPTRFGGHAGSTRDILAASRAVARGDGSTAWVYGIFTSGAWVTSYMPDQAQQEVWGEDPDTLITIVLAPTAESKRVEGGYQVSGRWGYGTGSKHSKWSILGIPMVDEQGNVVDNGLALVPNSELTYDDTWYVAGMKATGSVHQVADNIFIPEHRVISVTKALEADLPGTEFNPEAVYRTAFVPGLFMQLVGPHLGMGRAVLEKVVSSAAKKSVAYTNYDRQADAVSFQMAVAQATMLIETAEIVAFNNADALLATAERGEFMPYAERIHYRAHAGQIVAMITRAIEMLVNAHGSAGFADSSLIQRFWRDQAASARHGHLLTASADEAFGKIIVGKEDEARDVLPVV